MTGFLLSFVFCDKRCLSNAVDTLLYIIKIHLIRLYGSIHANRHMWGVDTTYLQTRPKAKPYVPLPPDQGCALTLPSVLIETLLWFDLARGAKEDHVTLIGTLRASLGASLGNPHYL